MALNSISSSSSSGSGSGSGKITRMSTILTLVALLIIAHSGTDCTQISVGVEHDLSGPTYGLEGKTGSALQYDDRNGLNMKGTLGDLLGPPIKIANGFGNIYKGHNMAGMGKTLKSGGALLGFDAKLLETAGVGNLVKGGLLMNGANYKTNVAGQLAGPKGQKIANIIEVPVRVVAMKDLATGKVLSGLAHVKQAEAQAINAKGQALYNQGQAMKTQGLNQIIQGANEGVQNIGNMAQKTSESFNSAYKLLPIVWDMQQQQQIQQVQQEDAAKGQQQVQQMQQLMSTPYQLAPSSAGSISGGSLFGGLTSLLPGLNSNGVGAGMAPNPAYAALWNSTNPLTSLLMNPAANPFLFPLTAGPLGQALASKQPIGTPEAQASYDGTKGPAPAPAQVFDFNLFPGLKYKESFSSQLPMFNFVDKFSKQAQQPVQQQQQQQVVQQKETPQQQQVVQQQQAVPQQVVAHQAEQELQPRTK